MTRNEFIAAALTESPYPSDQVMAALCRAHEANPQQEEFSRRDLEALQQDTLFHLPDEEFSILVIPD